MVQAALYVKEMKKGQFEGKLRWKPGLKLLSNLLSKVLPNSEAGAAQ